MTVPPPRDRPCRISGHRLRRAARILRGGGVIAHATEGVWGLACDPLDRDAVMRILAIKRRDPGKGLILIGHDADMLRRFVKPGADAEWQRARAAWPGPVTWLLPAGNATPWWITGHSGRVALRQSAHPEARALCRAFGGALVSTSANVSGRPPVTRSWRVRAAFGRGVDMVAGGRVDRPGVPSTIRDAGSDRVMRAAAP